MRWQPGSPPKASTLIAAPLRRSRARSTRPAGSRVSSYANCSASRHASSWTASLRSATCTRHPASLGGEGLLKGRVVVEPYTLEDVQLEVEWFSLDFVRGNQRHPVEAI